MFGREKFKQEQKYVQVERISTRLAVTCQELHVRE
jgi:hypothetical protein